MFGFGKKKKTEDIYTPVTGKIIPITEVKDAVFSEKMMGDGFAVEPEEIAIYAPVAGEISTVFPTKHALGITTAAGLEVLVHMGLDTVELKGASFENLVEVGQRVDQNTKISTMDVVAIREAGYDPTVVIVYTNMDKIKVLPEPELGESEHSQKIGTLEYK
ncbi:PTS glucose transporter subunit IIA [Lactobacillus sp. ESL0791]|uniref:PTS sugar transporter subunit IIA n=1 Tax=Lactobacillus sp. ESL0791 TaxID=2983234 RepID=UPI0023F8C7B7|nr:PTS glucose transporter subunit IIA [Lactobacillus sp. ESL0791]MDF7637995.1 PTS glucose transporter subunit IIA [Lactobacillus sp. ESL0791]